MQLDTGTAQINAMYIAGYLEFGPQPALVELGPTYAALSNPKDAAAVDIA